MVRFFETPEVGIQNGNELGLAIIDIRFDINLCSNSFG